MWTSKKDVSTSTNKAVVGQQSMFDVDAIRRDIQIHLRIKETKFVHIHLQLRLRIPDVRLLQHRLQLGRLHHIALNLELPTHKQLLRIRLAQNQLAKLLFGERKRHIGFFA